MKKKSLIYIIKSEIQGKSIRKLSYMKDKNLGQKVTNTSSSATVITEICGLL